MPQNALDKAIAQAIRDGDVEERVESGRRGMKERVLRTRGSRAVSVRPRGNREFSEIPVSEVAVLMNRLEQSKAVRDSEALYRAVLDFYSTKRMTSNLRDRLERVDEARGALLQGSRS